MILLLLVFYDVQWEGRSVGVEYNVQQYTVTMTRT